MNNSNKKLIEEIQNSMEITSMLLNQLHTRHVLDEEKEQPATKEYVDFMADASTADYNGEMTDEEIAAHFKEPATQVNSVKNPEDMKTLEEFNQWEAKQNNSNDIYKVAARIKNLARQDGRASLTDVGSALCNTYTHVILSFYKFAESMTDETSKQALISLIRKNESMPADFVAFINANIKVKK